MIQLDNGLWQDIFPPISQIVLKNIIKNSLIIKEPPENFLKKLTIVLKISKSSWNTGQSMIFISAFKIILQKIYLSMNIISTEVTKIFPFYVPIYILLIKPNSDIICNK